MNNGPVPTTYKEFEKHYPELVKTAMSALQEELKNTYEKRTKINAKHVLEAIEVAFKHPELKNLLRDFDKALAPSHSPRIDKPEPDYDENLNVENREPGLSQSSLKAVPWGAKFDSADSPIIDIAQTIANNLNQDKLNQQRNELQNKNNLKNKASLTPQFNRKKLEEALTFVMKTKPELRQALTKIPRATR